MGGGEGVGWGGGGGKDVEKGVYNIWREELGGGMMAVMEEGERSGGKGRREGHNCEPC